MDRLACMAAFVKAVELGSFSAVGLDMNLSSQAVGKLVSTLEQHLGVRLLNRTTRRQHLTDVGASYYERAKMILADISSAESFVAESHQTPRGRLRVNAPMTFGTFALSKKLPEYLLVNPQVSIELSQSNRYVDLVNEGFDVVIRIGELADSILVARSLRPYRLILCAAPSYLHQHPKITHPRDIVQHECLGFSHPELRTHWTFLGPLGQIVVPVDGRLIVDSGESLLAAARAGMGLLLQPFELVEEDLVEGRLVEVLPEFPAPTRPIHLLFAQDRQMTPKVRSFIEFILEHFAKHEAQL